MTNLLPREAQQALKKEYWLRVWTVWGVLFGSVLIGAGVLLIPSYLLIESERRAFESEYAELPAAAQNIDEIEREVTNANALADELQARNDRQMVLPLLEAVQTAVLSGVTVRSYKTERTSVGLETLTVMGVASSREALNAFQQTLREREEFDEANVPIEDFVKEEDLLFTVELKVAETFR